MEINALPLRATLFKFIFYFSDLISLYSEYMKMAWYNSSP